jgi:TolA-binding protein
VVNAAGSPAAAARGIQTSATPLPLPPALTADNLQEAVERALLVALATPRITEALCSTLVTRVMESLQSKIEDNTARITALEMQVREAAGAAQRASDDLERLRESNPEVEQLQQKITAMEEALHLQADGIEQAQRGRNLLLFGVQETDRSPKETKGAVLAVISSIGVDATTRDLDRVVRLGRRTDDKKRPILCRFSTEEKRREVFQAK